MTVWRHGPFRVGAVRKHVHQALVIVPQFESLARVGKPSLERSENIGHTELNEGRRIGGNDELGSAGQHGARRKQVGDPSSEPPTRQVHVHGHLVVQFDPFQSRFLILWVIVDLVEDHGAVRARPHEPQQTDQQPAEADCLLKRSFKTGEQEDHWNLQGEQGDGGRDRRLRFQAASRDFW